MTAHEEQKSWRQRRIDMLAERVADGDYWVPDVEIANAILFGRPRWGDNPQILVRGDVPVRVSFHNN